MPLPSSRDRLRLEQLFVKRAGGQSEILLVLEDISGARQRRRLQLPTLDAGEAVTLAARTLAQSGEIGRVSRVRVRRESNGALADDAELRRRFLAAWHRVNP